MADADDIIGSFGTRGCAPNVDAKCQEAKSSPVQDE
jgi:hypothetical protein